MITSILAQSLLKPHRQPLVKDPSSYGMSYEDISFTTTDGVRIEGWLIKGKKDKLVVMTHPMPFTRYGFSVRHQGIFKASNIEVELLKTALALNREGYHILTFDFRNHGASGKGNDGYTGVGCHEWPDVAGAMEYIAHTPALKKMKTGFVSHCMGANATIMAMSRAKDKFHDARCLVAVQPVSMDVLVPRMIKDAFPLFATFAKNIDGKCFRRTGLHLSDMSPLEYVKDIHLPVLYVQTKNDPWTEPGDIQRFHDATPGPKELFWIEGDKKRFDGYNYFGEHPERLISFLGKHM